MKCGLFTGALLASSVVSLGTAHAQTTGAEAVASETDLDTVVVAAKREQRLQDVSIAVSAVGADRLADAQVSNLESLQTLVPTLTIGQDNGVAKISLRGLGLNTSVNAAESGVAVHVDGAVISRPEAQLGSFFDLERVEVLRGPQGTLYGRNAVGGAINLITAKPTRELSGYVGATAGSYDQFDAEGAISGPITETLSARLAFRKETRSGFGRSMLTGQDVDDNGRTMARLQLLFEPNDRLSWLLAGEWFRQNDHSVAPHLGALAFPGTAFVPTGIGGYATNPRDFAGDADPFYDSWTWAITNTIGFEVNDWLRIVNLTNYREFEEIHAYDYDQSIIVNTVQTTGRPLSTHQKNNDSIHYSNELQFHTDFGWAQGVLAAFYFKEEMASRVWFRLTGNALIGTPADRQSWLLSGVPLETILGLCGLSRIAFDPLRADGEVNTPPNFCSNSQHETEVWSVFGQYSIPLERVVSGLSLKLGGRYNHESRHVSNGGGFASATGAAATVRIPAPGAGIGSRSFSEFTPEAGIEWKMNPDTLLYYTYSEGFKSGVGEGNAIGSNRIIDPEYIANHEVGLKLGFWDRRAGLNLAAFKYDVQGLQIQKTAPQAGVTAVPVQIFENATGVKAQGIEADFTLAPTSAFRLNVSAAYLDSAYTEYLTIDNLDPRNVTGPFATQPLSPVENREGNPTRHSPKWTIGGGLEYSFVGTRLPGNGTLTPRIDVFHRTTTYYTDFKRLAEGQEPYTLIDASIRYKVPDSGLSVSAWIKNLTDELVINNTYASPSNGIIANTYMPPRTYGATVSYRF